MKYIQGMITGITLTLFFLLIFNGNFKKDNNTTFNNDDIYNEIKKVKSLVEDIEDAIDVSGYGNKNDREIGLLVKYIAREIR
ncbi:MAG: hypothetical protein CMF98_06115 [Candidatus Marinimicrobia bacterium]|nr:hypothetical protein [Candidatus Neomarinimicrobiota bacterium]OUW49961.1 MAG: hypothetical protein CBD50_04395 [bacterium TMED190]|tara:strand:+ start:2049 stop:2294 length:246 start_codon:yes stop_codon:yes gene_type:complete